MQHALESTVFFGDAEAANFEANHRPTGDPLWQESWYFNFADPSAGVWGLTRIGYRPSRGVADGLLLAVIDGRPEVLYTPLGRPLSSARVHIDSPRRLKAHGLEYRCEAPLRRWHLKAETPRLDFDVTFEAETPAHLFPAMQSKHASAASDHYEQSGRVTGTLRLGDLTRSLAGRGQRDHSWGPRDWAGVGEWVWLSGQFASGWCMNFWSVGVGEGSTVTGFVGHEDRTIAAVGGSVRWIRGRTRREPRGAEIALMLADGSEKHIRMHVHTHWPLYKDGASIMELACTYECDGEVGAGISEHLYEDPKAWRTLLPRAPRLAWKALRTVW